MDVAKIDKIAMAIVSFYGIDHRDIAIVGIMGFCSTAIFGGTSTSIC